MANAFESQDYLDALIAAGNLPVNVTEGTGGPGMEMTRYVSHKKVWALEIAGFEFTNKLIFKEEGYAPIDAPKEMWARYTPIVGDFYVVYADGYKSFSPRKAFLEGYRRES